MVRKPKVTVGLCVKNSEATITETLVSLINQDYPTELFELIVVDGHSEDRTLEIIRKHLLKTEIKRTFFSENKGLGLARQIVVDNAKGDYIAWVDADIILPREYLRKQVEFMEKSPKVGIGRAKYGILPKAPIVAFLENIPFAVESLRKDKNVPLEISGTEGSIYRVEAIQRVGGFDTNITGAAEDTDVAHRIRTAGWSACLSETIFYERCRETWKDLWDEYSWWGYGGHYSFHKQRSSVNLFKMSPPAGFVAGILQLERTYTLTHRKSTFLLPFHYAFKRTAWLFGFVKAHIDGYGHLQHVQT
jgi:glycosyltransferase involved in cell wall biosynthesis